MELLVVIAIIAILVGLLLPAIQSAREAARRIQCGNNMRQVALALRNYEQQMSALPSGTILNVNVNKNSSNWCNLALARGYTPWTVMILPYVEQTNLYDKFEFGFHTGGQFMTSNFETPMPNGEWAVPLATFQCPSDYDRGAFVNYASRNNYLGVQGGGATYSCSSANSGNAGDRLSFLNGVLYTNSAINGGHIRDGYSNVFLLGETRYLDDKANWTISGKPGIDSVPLQLVAAHKPINYFAVDDETGWVAKVTQGFSSHHPGGCLATLADGSVHFLQESMDLETYRSMGIRDDGLPSSGLP